MHYRHSNLAAIRAYWRLVTLDKVDSDLQVPFMVIKIV